jgi:hypothetical protein
MKVYKSERKGTKGVSLPHRPDDARQQSEDYCLDEAVNILSEALLRERN